MQRKMSPVDPSAALDDMPSAAGAVASSDEFAEKNEAARLMSVPDAPLPAGDDLPDDVKQQLKGYSDISLESELLDCVQTASITGSLVIVDKIILLLWYRHKRKAERMKVIRTLNSMASRNIIKKQSSPRGYSVMQASTAVELAT